ncbi:sporulation protein [Pseudoxanthomonas yeongjuensis]|uniref:SPOR domain-containing protein n=1 Tax=Pseudoxanthomonas yeongjuensis TaxID=377616 RepID=UPI001391D16D|nr:SPOR domain-containing protein [Pseudoxanthomonas yeongjuensis]KAF1715996.1 sporulation protein [Pseudoxanthomonas yeongjuensis]
MLIRALIVLLVVLNLGVGAWWISRPAAQPPALPEQPAGVARLQLLSERETTAEATPPAPAPAVAPASTEAAPAPVVAAVVAAKCFSIGPFDSDVAATAAAARIAAQATRVRPREVAGQQASGYNVLLPPLADRAAAQALAQRIGAAGFDDFLVINGGEQANGIALGRYRSREGAERRQAALKAAGFDAQLQAIGNEGPSRWWLDIAAAEGVAVSRLRSLAAAPKSQSLDCAVLR